MHILPLIIVVCMKFIIYIFFIKDLTVNHLYRERYRPKKIYEAARLHEKNLI